MDTFIIQVSQSCSRIVLYVPCHIYTLTKKKTSDQDSKDLKQAPSKHNSAEMLLFKPPCLAHAYSVFKNNATCEANIIKTLQKPHLIPHIMYQIHYKQEKKTYNPDTRTTL